MADSNIGALPLAPNLADDSLLVVEQQGQAMRVTGQQLKSYAKEGVELEFQDYLDEAKEAADSAAGAVCAVTDMTVEARTLEDGQSATVTKSMRDGKVNLTFGLPRGERGVPGPAGETGPRGPQGAPGNGLTILGYYDTEEELRAAVTAPEVGEAYSVGTELPYDTYIFDGVTLNWKNHGPLSGGGGVVPGNVVTAEGGASIEIPASLGDAPHVITITDEEEPPLAAADVEYDGRATGMAAGTVQEAVDELFTCVSDGKALIASAVTDKGVPTPQDAAFAQLAENIGQISTGADTQDATATPGDILAPKTAYTKSGKVEGIIPSLPAQTITPGTADKTLANGQYLAGTQTIKGDPNLTSGNIKKGVSLFGVTGALETAFTATLTVKADVGAVVTATCGDTSLEALSTTGTVVLELPVEGTWKVTAVRGMAQYNTVTLEVSSQYSTELTAEVHVEYVGLGTAFGTARRLLASTATGQYALFGGGFATESTNRATGAVDAYDENLTRKAATNCQEGGNLAAAACEPTGYAYFGGGYTGISSRSNVSAYNANLTREGALLSNTSRNLAAAAIGEYVLFGGGQQNSSTFLSTVDAFSGGVANRELANLISGRAQLGAASNGKYALFCGGRIADDAASNVVDAFDERLTRTTPVKSGTSSGVAVRAGNYVLHIGDGVVCAYDLFLTKTEMECPIISSPLCGVTLCDFAVLPYVSETGEDECPRVITVDPYLIQAEAEPMEVARTEFSAAAIGGYALFGGGYAPSNGTLDRTTGTVEIYRYK